MDSTRQALIVLNPRAGSGEPALIQQILTQALVQYGWQPQCLILEKSITSTQLVEHVKKAVAEGTTLILAAGGDGTVSMVASAIIVSGQSDKVRLGVFPGGTANSIARELGIPFDRSMAAQLLASVEETRPLDAMKMANRYYFLRIGVGVDADVIRDTTRDAKRRLGRFAYVRTLLGQVFDSRRHRFYCTFDGREHRFHAVQVFVANGGHIALTPFPIGPDIAFDDGLINICAYDVGSWWQYLLVGWKLLRRNYQQQAMMKFWTVRRQVIIRAKKTMTVQGDGEACATTPVTIEIVPGALKVIAFKQNNS